MRRFLASTAIVMSTLALASGYSWAKGPNSGHSNNGGQGSNSGMGNAIQNLNKTWNQNTNQNSNQNGSKPWIQNDNKSSNQNMNQAIQNSNKSWNQEKSKAWNQNMKSQQTFDSKKHPDFMSGSGTHDNWRYRWNNGRWWFWAPDNRWAWYDDGRWSYDNRYVVNRPIFENFSGGPIKITNPASNHVTLSYVLDGVAYSVPPGYSQELREDRPWVIQFSRGPNMDEARYALRSGRYTFASTGHGWELYRTEFQQSTAPVNPPSQAPVNPPANPPSQAPISPPSPQ